MGKEPWTFLIIVIHAPERAFSRSNQKSHLAWTSPCFALGVPLWLEIREFHVEGLIQVSQFESISDCIGVGQ